MIHLGDITKMTPENTPMVDCVTFGSPCQDLSIAGKRAGLAGERSGLFMEAVRVIRQMRERSFGGYPKFAVWENVPGAFSSNKGEDFRAVLEELAHIKEPEVSIPRPENGKWTKAGYIAGNGWSAAWRTFDAQFWGVPQRRKRIALVVDFGGQRAGEILFEHTGVRRDSEPSIPPWQGVARNPAHHTAGHDRVVEGEGDCLTPWDVQSRGIYKKIREMACHLFRRRWRAWVCNKRESECCIFTRKHDRPRCEAERIWVSGKRDYVYSQYHG